MFPKLLKWLKPRMSWFLYGGLLVAVLSSIYMVFLAGNLPIDKVIQYHSQKKLYEVQSLLQNSPDAVKGIKFVSEKSGNVVDNFPHKVLLDRKDNSKEPDIWAPIAGNEEYVRVSKLADHNQIFIDSEIVDAPPETSTFMKLLGYFAPTLMVLVLVWFFMSKSGGLGGMGDQATKNGKVTLNRLDLMGSPVRLNDVQGIDDERKTIEELIRNLKYPQMLTLLQGEIPRGVLLVGPPGVGKTFILQAIAGETGIPILAGAGSDFVEQFVGVGASRVRDAFVQARQLRDATNGWVILFIDEFTTVGQNRANSGSGGSMEHAQTVDALLVELNGAGADNSRILFVAATNQPEGLDEAITRRGRLGDLKIEIGKPDKEGRKAILRIKLAKVPHLLTEEDIEKIATEMTGMTGADIDSLIRKGAPARAARRLFAAVSPELLLDPAGFDIAKHFPPEVIKINMDDVWFELMDMTLGTISETRGRRLDPQVKRMIAYHESGHFTVAMRKLLQNTGTWDGQYGDDITDISILGPNGVGGFVRTVPAHNFQTARSLKSRLAVALAGYVAERLFLKDTTGGCSNDLEQANRIIKAMLLQLNMSDRHNAVDKNGKVKRLPAISVQEQGAQSRFLRGAQGGHAPQYGMSDGSAWQVDELIAVMLDEAETEATAYLEEERAWVEYFAPILVARERMRFAEVKALWDQFHEGKDLSREFAFKYNWDPNHVEVIDAVAVEPAAGRQN
jgi:cell division protease FtsH